jgi:hypothetical protein
MSAILILVGIILGEGREGMMMSISHVGKCQRGFVAINLISEYKMMTPIGLLLLLHLAPPPPHAPPRQLLSPQIIGSDSVCDQMSCVASGSSSTLPII